MPKYEAEHFTVKIRWHFNSILPALPVPGTEPFAILVKEFCGYGLTPSNISLQTPTNNLGDVRLDVNLARYRVNLSFDYASLEIVINELFYEDIPTLFGMMKAAFNVLNHIDKSTEQGKGTTIIAAHLPLIDDTVEDFLARMVVQDGQMKFLIPDALAFRIGLDELSRQAEATIVFAKSIRYENALFTELTYNFNAEDSENAIEFHKRIAEHYKTVFGIFGLQEQLDDSGES